MNDATPIPLDEQKEALIRRACEEVARLGDFRLEVELDLGTILVMIGQLQLSLRHPMNTGTSTAIVRELIDALIASLVQAGYILNAELARLGYDSTYDDGRVQ